LRRAFHAISIVNMRNATAWIPAPDSAHFRLIRRCGRWLIFLGATLAFTLPGPILPAISAQAVTSSGSTVANVTVNSAITLSNLPASFTLTGIPGDTPSTTITMTVTTNNFLGYSVSVEAAAANLAPSIVGSTAVIPVGALAVRETTVGIYTPLSSTTPRVVHSQPTASASSGDTVSNDYQATIPFVRQDTYSGTLNYVATTL
jgi:hypothetical protein